MAAADGQGSGMNDFEVVPDELRDQVSRRAPELDAVLEGKTVFIPLDGKPKSYQTNWSIRVRQQDPSKKAVTRQYIKDGVKGLLVWTVNREVPA